MTTSYNLPAQFEAIRDSDEEIFWTGKPNFVAFSARGIPLLVFGLVWGAIDYFGFIRNMSADLSGFTIPFFALHLLPLWLGLLNMLRLLLVHQNTYYAFSNKRLMMRSGFWGTDFKVIDYDKISDFEINVNPIENMLGVGTIQAYSAGSATRAAGSTTNSSASRTPMRCSSRSRRSRSTSRPTGVTRTPCDRRSTPDTGPGTRDKLLICKNLTGFIIICGCLY